MQFSGTPAFSAKEIEGIKQAVKQMGGIPPIRQDRVEKVKKDFESSSYKAPETVTPVVR
jgi:hypothetical protein